MSLIKSKTRTQSAKVVIPAAVYAADSIVIATIELDKTYDEVDGVSVHVGNDAGVANKNYQIGLGDDNGDVEDFSHVGRWATGQSDGVRPNDRFTEQSIEIRGSGTLQCKVKMPAQNLGTALEVHFVARLRKNNERTS